MSLRDFNNDARSLDDPTALHHEPLGNGAGLETFHTVQPEDIEPSNTPKIVGAVAVALMVGVAGCGRFMPTSGHLNQAGGGGQCRAEDRAGHRRPSRRRGGARQRHAAPRRPIPAAARRPRRRLPRRSRPRPRPSRPSRLRCILRRVRPLTGSPLRLGARLRCGQRPDERGHHPDHTAPQQAQVTPEPAQQAGNAAAGGSVAFAV